MLQKAGYSNEKVWSISFICTEVLEYLSIK